MSKLAGDRSSQLEFLHLLLRPIVRFALRRSQSIQDFTNVAKVVFVEIAEEEIKKSTEKVNVSRLSVMTGLYRKDVTTIFRDRKPPKPLEQPSSVLWRVIGQWEQHAEYTTANGKPRILGYKGENNEFRDLVATVTKETDPGTLLFELKRIGAVEFSARGVKLVDTMYRMGEEERRGFELISRDIDNLICAAEENMTDTRLSNVQLSTEYDNIYVDEIPRIRRWLLEEAKALHRKAREFIARFDADVAPSGEERAAGGKVSLGSFSFTSELPEDIADEFLRPDQRAEPSGET
ncbi:MAG: hypothetical protein KDD66_03960 [Bdellovibrionales bacterium]|nr:hypothetical protein [Bdellovibrionales bacterium]